MGYMIFNIVLAIWQYFDAKKRSHSPFGWCVGTLFLGPFVVPYYIAVRTLLVDEIREGGTGWNFLKNLAIFWTLMMLVVGFSGMVGMAEASKGAVSDAEKAGAGLGMLLGMGMMFALWFFPVLGALVLGLILKKSSVIERGTAGAIADGNKLQEV